jgi:hypothetical protein
MTKRMYQSWKMKIPVIDLNHFFVTNDTIKFGMKSSESNHHNKCVQKDLL